jgi:hypothetical protein
VTQVKVSCAGQVGNICQQLTKRTFIRIVRVFMMVMVMAVLLCCQIISMNMRHNVMDQKDAIAEKKG